MDSFVSASPAASAAALFSGQVPAAGLFMPVEALTRGFDLAPEEVAATTAEQALLAQLQGLQAPHMQPLTSLSAEALMAAPASAAPTPAISAALAVPGGAMVPGLGVSDALTSAAAEQRQGFLVGDIGLMIGYEDGSELTEMPQLFYLPNAPVWCMGVANLHGNIVPVFDVANYLGTALSGDSASAHSHLAPKRMLLVLAHGPDAAGIIIEGMPQRLYIAPQQKMPPDVAPDKLLPHVRSAVLVDGRLWFDLQASSLLEALERGMQTA